MDPITSSFWTSPYTELSCASGSRLQTGSKEAVCVFESAALWERLHTVSITSCFKTHYDPVATMDRPVCLSAWRYFSVSGFIRRPKRRILTVSTQVGFRHVDSQKKLRSMQTCTSHLKNHNAEKFQLNVGCDHIHTRNSWARRGRWSREKRKGSHLLLQLPPVQISAVQTEGHDPAVGHSVATSGTRNDRN